ncbi:hypothetical protein [uncultured Streptomyces sp.]|uniref:hypothetical protein n=1 Tax=uncultured Streptomyces sp. TaxID=174707 RepID=UPI00261BE0B7|nr:hypothetical protein [uncultured Streptomyces sp.]
MSRPTALAQAIAALIPGADEAATRVTVTHEYIELGYERRDSWSGSALGLAHRLADHVDTEKDTAASAAAAFTPVHLILTGLARALREQPTGRRILDGLVVTGDGTAAETASWVTALAHLAGVDVAAPPSLVYRAHHDAIGMGVYATPAEARRCCETALSREYPEDVALTFDWIGDDEDPLEPMELVVEVAGGDEEPTGYTVTPIEVQAAYDPDADE